MNALLLFHLAYIMTRCQHVTPKLTNSQKANCETFKICMFHCFKHETRLVASATQDKAKAQSLRSGVWKFFEIVEGDNSKALCKVCQRKPMLLYPEEANKVSSSK